MKKNIKRNNIDEAINGNKAELFKDTNGFYCF